MQGPTRFMPGNEDALIVVDVQNDFLPAGALGVPRGDEVMAPANRAIALFHEKGLRLFFSRDWHPSDHCSFLEQGGPWPAHCVADTPGAGFGEALDLPAEATIVSKAMLRDRDAYSALDGTGLTERLKQNGIERVFVAGLATDYCVKATVLDALTAGFGAVVLEDAVRAVNIDPDDGRRALKEMRTAGAQISRVTELVA